MLDKIKTTVIKLLIKYQPKTIVDLITILSIIVSITLTVYNFFPQIAEFSDQILEHTLSE